MLNAIWHPLFPESFFMFLAMFLANLTLCGVKRWDSGIRTAQTTNPNELSIALLIFRLGLCQALTDCSHGKTEVGFARFCMIFTSFKLPNSQEETKEEGQPENKEPTFQIHLLDS